MPISSLFGTETKTNTVFFGLPLHPCLLVSAHICGSVHLNLLFPLNPIPDSAMGSQAQTDQWLASHSRRTHSYTHTLHASPLIIYWSLAGGPACLINESEDVQLDHHYRSCLLFNTALARILLSVAVCRTDWRIYWPAATQLFYCEAVEDLQ